MVAGAADCADVLPGEFGKRQTTHGVSGHAGWGMVPAVCLGTTASLTIGKLSLVVQATKN